MFSYQKVQFLSFHQHSNHSIYKEINVVCTGLDNDLDLNRDIALYKPLYSEQMKNQIDATFFGEIDIYVDPKAVEFKMCAILVKIRRFLSME